MMAEGGAPHDREAIYSGHAACKHKLSSLLGVDLEHFNLFGAFHGTLQPDSLDGHTPLRAASKVDPKVFAFIEDLKWHSHLLQLKLQMFGKAGCGGNQARLGGHGKIPLSKTLDQEFGSKGNLLQKLLRLQNPLKKLK